MSYSKAGNNKILLLDLDGVTIHGETLGDGRAEQIRLLHPELASLIEEKNFSIVLFTHRAFADASAIHDALAGMGVPILHCISAREIMLSAIKQARFAELLSGGLSKKFGIAAVVSRFEIEPAQLTLIDDRPEILKEVLKEGVGLGLLAPFKKTSQQLVSFDFKSALELIEKNTETPFTQITLDAVEKQLTDLPIIISIAGSNATTFSLFARKIFRKTRQLVKKARG